MHLCMVIKALLYTICKNEGSPTELLELYIKTQSIDLINFPMKMRYCVTTAYTGADPEILHGCGYMYV